MIVRLATYKDMLELDNLCIKLMEERDFGMKIHQMTVSHTLDFLIRHHLVTVATESGRVIGVLAGFIAKSYMSKDIVFQEVFFYLLPKQRQHTRKLIEETEEICHKRSVTKMIMAIPAGKSSVDMQRFYSMLMYKPLEVHVIKEIKP